MKSNRSTNAALTLTTLPEELIMEILTKLALPELRQMTLVSRLFGRLARDTHLWKGLFFTVPPSTGVPNSRLWCTTVVVNSKMYLFGGHTTQESTNLISDVKSDLYEYDFETRVWTPLDHEMGGKTEHKCVPYNNCLWFTGGYNGHDYTNDTYTFDPITRTSAIVQTTGERFSPRSALTVGIWDGKMYTFGGWNGFTRKWFNDVHELDLETKTWRHINPRGVPPVQRTSHASVIRDGKMYIFGGFSGENYLNDLWELDIATETWTDISEDSYGQRPAPRSRFCAAVYGDCMYILGGWNKVGYFEDLHSFNFVTKMWTKIDNLLGGPPSISQYSFSIHKNLLYVFGGYCSKRKECVNDLLVYRFPEDEGRGEAAAEEPPKKRSREASISMPRKMFEEVVSSC